MTLLIFNEQKKIYNKRQKKKYKRKDKRKHKIKGEGFRNTLKNYFNLMYKGLVGNETKKKLCRGKTCCTKKSNST